MRNTKEKINIVGLKELRNNTESYIRKLHKGQSFTVVRRSKPIFNITPIDEWGDDGKWETVIDFTKFKKGGVMAEKVLTSLGRLEKHE